MVFFLVVSALKEAGSCLGEEEGPWKLLGGRKSSVKFCDTVVETEFSLTVNNDNSSSSSSDCEDGAALRSCHVSVYWRNINISQKDSNICGVVVFLSGFSLCCGGWVVHLFWPDQLDYSGKCGVGFGELYSSYSCGVLRFVVCTLHRFFSSLQRSSQRH